MGQQQAGTKIIFLDVDGVLNSLSSFESKDDSFDGMHVSDASKLSRLETIVEKTSAKVMNMFEAW